jgi:hypothetical protein
MSKNGAAIFDLEHLQEMVQANRALVDERSPDSELWFLGQAHSNPADGFRMPTVQEMEKMFDAASQEGVDGFLWYAWLHDQYEIVLNDPEVELQREAIQTIYKTYIENTPVK